VLAAAAQDAARCWRVVAHGRTRTVSCRGSSGLRADPVLRLGFRVVLAQSRRYGLAVQVVLPGFGEIVVLEVSALLEGLAFGMLLRSSAAAIAVYFVVPSVWSALFSAASLKHVAPWIDLNQAQSPLYTPGQITGTGWLQLLVAGSIWVFLPLAAGTVRALRSEIRTAG
jgi:hypothetical protein